MNIRIAMAKVGNDFRFVGYDMSQGGPEGAVHSGFVESEMGTTSGVGRALFADRVTRALLNRADGMNLEVYSSQRTTDFHAQIFAVAGRQDAPREGQRYQLTTGEMAKLAVAWNPKLTATQVSNLRALLARGDKVSPAEAEGALLGRGPGKPSGSSSGLATLSRYQQTSCVAEPRLSSFHSRPQGSRNMGASGSRSAATRVSLAPWASCTGCRTSARFLVAR